MPRATCQDCPWTFEGDYEAVVDVMERHARKEMHDVRFQREVATDGGQPRPNDADDGEEVVYVRMCARGSEGSVILHTEEDCPHLQSARKYREAPRNVYPEDARICRDCRGIVDRGRAGSSGPHSALADADPDIVPDGGEDAYLGLDEGDDVEVAWSAPTADGTSTATGTVTNLTTVRDGSYIPTGTPEIVLSDHDRDDRTLVIWPARNVVRGRYESGARQRIGEFQNVTRLDDSEDGRVASDGGRELPEVTFASEHVDALQAGEKTVTIRIDFDHDLEPYQLVRLVDDGGDEIALARVTTQFAHDADIAASAGFAGHRQYTTYHGLLDELREHYPDTPLARAATVDVVAFQALSLDVGADAVGETPLDGQERCDCGRLCAPSWSFCPACGDLQEDATGETRPEMRADGGRDIDDDEYYVVDEARSAVVAGPYDDKHEAAADARDRIPGHIVATAGALELIALTSQQTIRWENNDDGVDVVTDGGQVVEAADEQHTPPYQGDPDEWSYGDPYHGFNVPVSVRRGGATGPTEREVISENGAAYRGHAVNFECEECGAVRRFVTSAFVTSYRCDDCGDLQWFRFDWELNRGGEPDA